MIHELGPQNPAIASLNRIPAGFPSEFRVNKYSAHPRRRNHLPSAVNKSQNRGVFLWSVIPIS